MVFKKGQSGNPAGRPKGAVGRVKSFVGALESFSQDDTVRLLRKLHQQGLGGDSNASKIFLSFMLPKCDKHYELAVERERRNFDHLSTEEITHLMSMVERPASSDEGIN